MALVQISANILCEQAKFLDSRCQSLNSIIAGKYASLYLKRVFFFDSNPPLGKLLLAAVAFFTGFDGEVNTGCLFLKTKHSKE